WTSALTPLDYGMRFRAPIALASYRVFCTGILLLWVAVHSFVQAQDFAVTEFAASNSSGLADEDGDFNDWIEIYNASAAPASLEGWSLTDDRGDLQKWRFPATTVPGRAFLVVFASEKN